jgi:release factor glutamine methyltransferase
MLKIQAALRQGTQLLEEARVDAPRLTAEVLLCHALGREKTFLYAHPEDELSELAWIHYGRYLHERLQGKPTQYITHRQEFYGRDFHVTPDVLIPRPETEHVIERALALGPRRVVDVGCGSGAIAITLNLECGAAAFATDISEAALSVARYNARHLEARVGFVACDVLSGIADGSVDMVASNPPYVSHAERDGLQREVVEFEPHVALFGGESGYEIYERLAEDARRVLQPDGWLVMELGFRSEPRVRELLAGWSDVQVSADLAGLPRVISARRPA